MDACIGFSRIYQKIPDLLIKNHVTSAQPAIFYGQQGGKSLRPR
jgi:hypothetical protein